MNRSDPAVYPAIELIDELPSTNAELLARGRGGAPHATAIRARVQTAGRGRRAHRWSSPDGGLYLSVLIRPNIAPDLLPGLPVACALGVLRAVHAVGCEGALLKWPNDILAEGGKLAGVLVELGTSREGEFFAVCGVGVNLSSSPGHAGVLAERPSSLEPANLSEHLSPGCHLPPIDGFADTVRACVLGEVERWSEGLSRRRRAGEEVHPLSGIVTRYNAFLAYRGEQVIVRELDGPEISCGVLLGVDDCGRALVREDGGQTLELDCTSASIRPARPA